MIFFDGSRDGAATQRRDFTDAEENNQ